MTTLTFSFKSAGGSADWSTWTLTPVTPCTMALSSSIPTTTFPTNHKSTTATGSKLTLTGTWESIFGIPAGSTISGVTSKTLQHKCTTFTGGTGCTTIQGTIVDGATNIPLNAATAFSATGASFSNDTAAADTTGLSLASSDSITLTVGNTLGVSSSNSDTVVLQQDNLQFTINYIPPLPSNQGDWPNPNRPKDPSGVAMRASFESPPSDQASLFRGQDRVYGGPGEVPDYDWPNPLRLKDAWGVSARAQDAVWQNFQGTLFVVTQAPFGQDDWPNPRRIRGAEFAATTGQANVWQNTLTNVLLGQDDLPTLNFDWPNPNHVRGAEGVALLSENGVWQNGLLNVLAGKDRLPFRQPDWPNPRGAARSNPDHVFRNLPILLGADVLPFNQGDWPNPQAPQRNPDFIFRNTAGLLGLDVLPFRNLDWPNPRAAERLQPIILPDTLVLRVTVASPFTPPDWPNPRSAPRSVPWTDVRNAALFQPAAAAMPFAQYDWPNPRGTTLQIAMAATAGTNPSYIPTPPVTGQTPWAGFTSNTGRMMTRRG